MAVIAEVLEVKLKNFKALRLILGLNRTMNSVAR